MSWKSMDTALAVIALLSLGLVMARQVSFRGESVITPGLGVSELVEKVKSELEAIDFRRINKKEPALFALEGFDLEVSFVVKEVSGGTAGVSFEVVTLESAKEIASEKVQKVTLSWKPVSIVMEGNVPPDEKEILK